MNKYLVYADGYPRLIITSKNSLAACNLYAKWLCRNHRMNLRVIAIFSKKLLNQKSANKAGQSYRWTKLSRSTRHWHFTFTRNSQIGMGIVSYRWDEFCSLCHKQGCNNRAGNNPGTMEVGTDYAI